MAVKTYWDNYAYIYDGEVKNIAVFDPNGSYTNANMFAKEIYGSGAFAVNVNDYPVAIGDSYKEGNFYRDNTLISPVDEISDSMTEIKMALAELGNLVAGGK
jgi:hypothetical protein